MALRPFARYIVVIKERFVTLAVCASHTCGAGYWQTKMSPTSTPSIRGRIRLSSRPSTLSATSRRSQTAVFHGQSQAASSISLVSSVSAFRKLRDERSAPQREPDAFSS
jgi:hypothetical protein